MKSMDREKLVEHIKILADNIFWLENDSIIKLSFMGFLELLSISPYCFLPTRIYVNFSLYFSLCFRVFILSLYRFLVGFLPLLWEGNQDDFKRKVCWNQHRKLLFYCFLISCQLNFERVQKILFWKISSWAYSGCWQKESSFPNSSWSNNFGFCFILFWRNAIIV